MLNETSGQDASRDLTTGSNEVSAAGNDRGGVEPIAVSAQRHKLLWATKDRRFRRARQKWRGHTAEKQSPRFGARAARTARALEPDAVIAQRVLVIAVKCFRRRLDDDLVDDR